jgi:replication factor C subunit 1
VILRGNKKPVNYAVKDPPKVNARACLISGAPGIGKTTCVRLIAKKLGFHLLELNASDARGKNRIEELLKGLSQTRSISNAFASEP